MEFILVALLLWLWMWALYDAVTRPEEVWRRVGESKTIWVLLIVVLQFFGPLFYFWRVRPKLIDAHQSVS